MNTSLNKQKYPVDIFISTTALQLPLPIALQSSTQEIWYIWPQF